MNDEVEQARQRQRLFVAMYGRCLRRAVAEILKVTWEAVKDMSAAKFDIDGMEIEVGSGVCGSSEKVAVAALWVSPAEKLYLAMRENYFLENVMRRLGAVRRCFVAPCGRDERLFEMLK